MANALPIIEAIYTSGSTLYAILRDRMTGKVWNTSGTPAFEVYNAAHWASYAIAMTEQASSGYYTSTRPAGVAGFLTSEQVFNQAGGGPATSDGGTECRSDRGRCFGRPDQSSGRDQYRSTKFSCGRDDHESNLPHESDQYERERLFRQSALLYERGLRWNGRAHSDLRCGQRGHHALRGAGGDPERGRYVHHRVK